MSLKQVLAFVISLFVTALSSGQSMNQSNIDFEFGNTSVWRYDTGVCCPFASFASSVPLPSRHAITSGTGVDFYGGFPVVAPGGGTYSFKLGNDQVGSEAERAEYHVHVPAGTTDYSLVFHYAVVLQDPGHDPADQPRFAVSTYDSATGDLIPCAQFLYVAADTLPGFHMSPVDSSVYYKDWSMGVINLRGYNGKTIVMNFTSGDCALGAHFGYGYFDVSQDPTAISESICSLHSDTLVGPTGFDTYFWYDKLFTTLLDTTPSIAVTGLNVPVTYAVVVKHVPDLGCVDTLFTTVYPSKLTLQPIDDIKSCGGRTVTLTAKADSGKGPLTYSWTSNAEITCPSCQSAEITITDISMCVVKVTDSAGCSLSDTLHAYLDVCDLVIPNAFTPNNDGRNDLARVTGTGFKYYSNFSLSIFNRFGQRVFYTDDIYAGWDGVFNGAPQDLGVYFYEVFYTLNDVKHILKGDITLLR